MLLSAELPLGLSLTEILLHILNFCILLIGVRFLLWKPVKKFIEKRKAEYQAAEDSSVKIVKDAEDLKENYKELMQGIENEKDEIIRKITDDANNKADVIIKDAEIQAQDLIADGKKAAKSEALKIKNEMNNQIIELSVGIADKILHRELLVKDNNKLIEDCLEEWKKHE